MILSAQNITKKYSSETGDNLVVLNDISFNVNEGDYLSILGASGAGKSTLLNILASLDKPDVGKLKYINNSKEIIINNLNDAEISNWRNKEIGFIFQFHHLLPEFTALENIYIPALIGKIKKSEFIKRAEELIGLVGLKDRKDHRPSQLSGGEQQRIAIARALINNPKIIFADEPTGNLDKENSDNIIKLITDLQSKLNLTFITATHSESVASHANKIIKISSGRLV